MTELGFYPYQAAIGSYGDGGFRFADMSHRGSLLCLPTGMHAWTVTAPDQISLETLAPVLACADALDVLLIGAGDDIVFLDPAVRAAFGEKSVVLEASATGAAVRTYNVMLAEDRRVGAALIATNRPKRR